jgi:hypothetical protein
VARVFTVANMRTLLGAQPFIPFRLHLSDGGKIDVPSRELVFPWRFYAIVGLLDPQASDLVWDRYASIWYMHITRVEMLGAGPPPLTPPAGPSESPSPALT